MVLVRVLQRKDAASLVVAIAAGLFVAGFITSITRQLSSMLSGIDSEVEFNFTDDLWFPLVSLVLQLVALELVIRVAIALRGAVAGRK